MKKLIVAVAIMTAGFLAQAANVKWSSDVIYAPNADGTFSETKLYSEKTIEWTLTTTVTFYDTDGKEITSLTEGTVADGVNKSSKATSATLDADYNFIYNNTYGYSIDYDLVYGGKEYTMSVGKTDWLANKGSGSHTPTFATASAWQTVPEPTSGLLLLLGVAGLALRRRRA